MKAAESIVHSNIAHHISMKKAQKSNTIPRFRQFLESAINIGSFRSWLMVFSSHWKLIPAGVSHQFEIVWSPDLDSALLGAKNVYVLCYRFREQFQYIILLYK